MIMSNLELVGMSNLKKSITLIDYVTDLDEEVIVLKDKSTCDVTELPEKVPSDGARYHLFRFKHNYEGDSFDSNGNFGTIALINN